MFGFRVMGIQMVDVNTPETIYKINTKNTHYYGLISLVCYTPTTQIKLLRNYDHSQRPQMNKHFLGSRKHYQIVNQHTWPDCNRCFITLRQAGF